MIKDRSRLGYGIGALLFSVGVVFVCLLPPPPVFASLLTVLCAALTAFINRHVKKAAVQHAPLLRETAAGLLAGAGLMLLTEALIQESLPALLALDFTPVFTGLARCLIKKEPVPGARLLCLLLSLAGAAFALFFAGLSFSGLFAAILFALAALTGETKAVRGKDSVFLFVSALFGACLTSLITGEAFSFTGIALLSVFGPVLLGAGFSLCRGTKLKKEDALWLRAAVPVLPLLFFEPLVSSDILLLAAFLVPAGGALFCRMTHAPVKYVTGQESLLLRDSVPVCFYNGVLCVHHPLRRFTSAANFRFIMLNSNRGPDRRYHARPETVRHEYGHILQARALGPFRFWRFIALPSMRGYFKKVPYADYYNQPWERGADRFGGVERAVHSESSLLEWEDYFMRILPKRRRAQYIKRGKEENDPFSE